MTKGGLLPKGFERPTVLASPSDSGVQEKYEEVKSSSKTIVLRIYGAVSEMDYCIGCNFGSKKSP